MAPTEDCRTIGILALQGAFEEHEASFKQLPAELQQQFRLLRVNKAKQLDDCHALVIPGGESTTMKIIGNDNSDSFMATLRAYVHGGEGADGKKRPARPVWGTCAGCILLSDDVVNTVDANGEKAPKRCKFGDGVGGLAVSTCRNFFGRQAESFEAAVITEGSTADDSKRAFQDYPGVFIRAPAILRIHDGARALARVRHPSFKEASEEGVVVAAESDKLLVTTFHPELSDDSRVHRYFVERFVLTQ